VQQLITSLRTEAGAARVNAKATAAQEARDSLAQDIGRALGLVTEGDPAPDPAQLTEQVTAAQEAARTAQVELAVHRAAHGLKGDPSALLDSRSFLAKVGGLDPGADDFAAQVSAAITSAITENPKLAVAAAAGASSVDHTGGTGEPHGLDAQITAAEKAGDHRTAIRLKRQKATS
jgi:hypothetical protein